MTRVKSRKPIGFILPAWHIEFTKPIFLAMRKPFCDMYQVHQACLSYGYIEPNKTTLLVVHIKLQTYNESMQISIQMHWDLLHALNPTAVPLMCL